MPRTLMTIILALIFHLASAQKINDVPPVNITPLHTFLQKNADTTIILSVESNFAAPPTYRILSKKEDTITLYKYASEFKKNLVIPTKIKDSLYKLYRPHESFNVGVNRFFTVVNIDDETAITLWQKISSLKPFQMEDDRVFGQGCPGKDNNIYDGGGISLYLVTKNNIKRLYFYAPQYYEKEICPGRAGRQNIIKLQDLFSAHFEE